MKRKRRRKPGALEIAFMTDSKTRDRFLKAWWKEVDRRGGIAD